MLGIDYDCSADLWSFACMIFELITGDFLFDPRKGSPDPTGKPKYSKSDDHLAQIIEMLGPIPKTFAFKAAQLNKFFRRDGSKWRFANIGGLQHFPLEMLLTDKYRLRQNEAAYLADFLNQVLRWEPSERCSAQQLLKHPWLSMSDDYETKMSDQEF